MIASLSRSVAVIFLLTAATFGQALINVKIAPETETDDDIVTLGSVAQMEGEAALSGRLRAISLGYAPAFGAVREIGESQLRTAIAAAGVDSKLIRLSIPDRILVRRRGVRVPPEMIRKVVEDEFRRRFVTGNTELASFRCDVPEDISTAPGEPDIRPVFASVTNPFGRISVPVELRVSGRIVRRFTVTVESEGTTLVLIAKRDLKPGERFAESDVALERKPVDRPLRNYYSAPDEIRGITPVRTVSATGILVRDDFILTVVIRNGDPVRVEARSAGLKVIISGEARASGRIGDRIAVKNLQSGAILQAVVADEGLVRISF
jgi:flagella basal body P-ring formation protein FlgA